MIDEDVFFCLIRFVEPVIVAVFLIIGIPLWVVGTSTKTRAFWQTFTSIPLYAQNNEFPINQYYITKSQSSFPNSVNITIPINYDDYKKKDIYILHNMWGFKVKATLFINDAVVSTVQIEQNLDPLNPTVIERFDMKKIPIIGSSLKKLQLSDNYFKVYCPYPTAITNASNIDSYCNSDALPMKFESKYSINSLFPSFDLSYFEQMVFNFDASYFVPYNYFETPELYIIYFKNSYKKSMCIAGIVLTSMGLVLLVGFIIFDCIALVSFLAED